MSRKVVLIVALLLSLAINIPSKAVAMPTKTLDILPNDCRIPVGKELPLTLEGFVPPNAKVNWAVNDGGITSGLSGPNAIFVAPAKPGVVTISVSISPAIPGMESFLTRQCVVTSLNKAPRGLAQAEGMDTIAMPLLSLRLSSALN